MTLVLSAASNEAIVMVADRRLTHSLTGCVCDEKQNKLVVYGNHFVFAFSGLAQIEGENVDQWLGRGLRANANFEAAVDGIARRATEIFAKLPRWLPKRQAFVGLGWAKVRENSLGPLWICVSNAWDPATEDWLATARPTFTVTARRMRPDRRWAPF